MISTTYKVMTPHGAFEAQWDEDEEIPVRYVGSEDAIAFFRAYLELNSVSGRGGDLLNPDVLEPADLYGFCQSAQYGITVLPSPDDLSDEIEDNDMNAVLDAVSDAETFALIGEGAGILKRLNEDADTFFSDIGRLREIVAAMGEGSDEAKTQGALPWDGAPSTFETRWYGTTIRLTAIDRNMAAKGLLREGEAILSNVINGGKALAVVWPGMETSTRHTITGQYIVEVINLKDSIPQIGDDSEKPGSLTSKTTESIKAAGMSVTWVNGEAPGYMVGTVSRGTTVGALVEISPDGKTTVTKLGGRADIQADVEKALGVNATVDVPKEEKTEEVDPEQAAYTPFDMSKVKMPTAVQLGAKLTTSYGSVIRNLEGSEGWTEGHILDLGALPNFVKKVTDEVFGGELGSIKQDMWERIVDSAKRNSIKIEPVANYDSEFSSIDNKQILKGKSNVKKTPINAFVLANTESGLAVSIDKRYFGYFAKTYKGAEFFAADDSGPVLVKHRGKVVGVVMPIRGDGANTLKRAMKAKDAIQSEDSKSVDQAEQYPDDVVSVYAVKGGKTKMIIYKNEGYPGLYSKRGDYGNGGLDAPAKMAKQVGYFQSDFPSAKLVYGTAVEELPGPEELNNQMADEVSAESELMAQASDNNDSAIKQRDEEKSTEAKTFLQSVIDQTTDMMDLELADRLTAIHDKYSGDTEMLAMFNDAAKSYSGYMVAEAKKALA